MTVKWKWNKPLLQGYSNQHQKGYDEITPDAGIPFRRLKFTDVADLVSFRVVFTRNEYIDFMAWYLKDIRQGTIPFLFPDCRYETERMARLVSEPPQYNTLSNMFEATLTIAFESEVLNVERILIVNSDDPLIVYDNDNLAVSQSLVI